MMIKHCLASDHYEEMHEKQMLAYADFIMYGVITNDVIT
jgi:hypothetical protein